LQCACELPTISYFGSHNNKTEAFEFKYVIRPLSGSGEILEHPASAKDNDEI
jgi:hypothetical protein